MFGLFKKKKTQPDESVKKAVVETTVQTQPAVQDWMPVVDVFNSVIKRRDGHLVTAIRVQPLNMGLLSDKEQARKVAALHEILNGQQRHFQIVCIGRPVDLDGYIAKLDQLQRDAQDMIRRRILQNNMRQAAAMATGGEAIERRFYILLSQPPGKLAEQELMQRATELAASLSAMELFADVCDDRELMDLLFVFTHPAQAAYERMPVLSGPYFPPQLSAQYSVTG